MLLPPSYTMLSIFRVVSLLLIALSLFSAVDAYSAKRAPVGSNGERLAKRLPLPRPKRLYDPNRRTWCVNVSFTVFTRISSIGVVRADPSATPTITSSARYVRDT